MTGSDPDYASPPVVRPSLLANEHFHSLRHPAPWRLTTTREYVGRHPELGAYRKLAAAEPVRHPLPTTSDPALHDRLLKHAVGVAPERFVAEIAWGRIYAQGVVITPTNELLRDVSEQFYRGPDRHVVLEQGDLPLPDIVDASVAVLASIGEGNYYHWLLECLPRLAPLVPSQVDVYYVNDAGRPGSFQDQWLAIAGVPADRVYTGTTASHVQARRVVVTPIPGLLNHPSQFACEFVRRLGSTMARPGPRRVYVSRAAASRRRVLNESEEVWPALEDQGFEKIELEEMSVVDQITAFASAEVVVGPFGAGLTNMVFSPPGARVVELFAPRCVRPNYWALADACGHAYGCVLGEGSVPEEHDADDGGADMVIDVRKLMTVLRSVSA